MEKTVTTQPKVGFLAKCFGGIRTAKNGLANASRISDICVLKIRDILKKVNFDDVRKGIDLYAIRLDKKVAAAGISRAEKAKLKTKSAHIGEVKDYITVLENFANGGELEAPTDAVLAVISDIAEDKKNQALVVILRVVQIVLKTVKGIKQVQKNNIIADGAEDVEDAQTSQDNAMIALNSMVAIAAQDGVITDAEKQMLVAQADSAHISMVVLDSMIEMALNK